MDELLTVCAQAMIPVIGSLVTGLVTWIGVEARKYIKAKAENALVENALTRISHTVETVVSDLSMTLAAEMKAQADDGRLTMDNAKFLKCTAVERIRNQLPATVMKDASLGVNSIESFMSSKIEQSLAKAKGV